jgi:hypothetical protein
MGHRLDYADYFWLYPWMVDSNNEHIIAATPGRLAIHSADEFLGQQSPDLSRREVAQRDFDAPLLARLLERWNSRFTAAVPTWSDIALFRSLNMAYHAMMFPGGQAVTYHDAGRLIGLWVAAFEILIHPGGGQVGWRQVADHLEAVHWEHPRCVERTHNVGTPERPRLRNLASWIYKNLNDRRNDFFHGNPVAPQDLALPEGRTLFSLAATLYRPALARHIGLAFGLQIPVQGDAEAIASYMIERSTFMEPQRDIETALMLSLVPDHRIRAERERILDERRQARHWPI